MAFVGLTDFHTHILPAMDDGSSSVEESLKMLADSASQGVKRVVLTPHFYADRDNPEHFLAKRERCYAKLCEAIDGDDPQLFLGAEIAYFEGLSQMSELESFVISGTKALLIEMPFRPWTERLVSDVVDLARHSGFTVVLAHVERYGACADDGVFKRLAASGVLMQSNANSFLSFFSRAKALTRLDKGLVHLLGSDCHDPVTRPPNLGKAYSFIQAKRGADSVRALLACGERLFFAK